MNTIEDYKKWLNNKISELEAIYFRGDLDESMTLLVSEKRRLETYKECLQKIEEVENNYTNFTF